MSTRGRTGLLLRCGGAFAFKTGRDLCVRRPNRLGASLDHDFKKEIPAESLRSETARPKEKLESKILSGDTEQ